MAATTRKHPAIPSKTPNKAGSGPAGVPNQYPTRQDAYAAGKALRASCPREAHADWKAPANRRDPVELVLWAEKGRVRDLLPLRHGRMVRSAFTFYRGAALTMAADLSATPSSWIRVQCCGDRTCATSADLPRRSGG
jgi:hypothetical protein